MSEDLGLDQLTDDQLVELAAAIAQEVVRRRDGDVIAAAQDGVRLAQMTAATAIAEAEAAQARADADVDAARKKAREIERDRIARIEMAERGVKVEVDGRARAVENAAAEAAPFSRADIAGFDDWALARRAAMMIKETLGDQFSFQAWRGKTGTRRVYLEGRMLGGARGERLIGTRIVYHVDGDSRFPPGYIDYEEGDFDRFAAGDFGKVDQHRIAAILRYIATCWDERPAIPVRRALAATVTPAPRPAIYAERIL